MALLIICWIPASAAQGEFSESERSINGTGETLGRHSYQLGFSELYYGVTDYITVGVPTFSLIAGRGKIEIRNKILWGERWRLTPALAAGPVPYPEAARSLGFERDKTKPYLQMSVDGGVDLGGQRQHSLNLGLDLRVVQGMNRSGRSKQRYLADLRTEYDYYINGNLLYFGIQRLLPYGGFTWAWKNWHLGLITSPLSYFIPLPYVYLKF